MVTTERELFSQTERERRDWRAQCSRCGFDSQSPRLDKATTVFVERNPATDSPYWIHCPKCPGEKYSEEVVLDRESGKTKRIPFPEKTESQKAMDCFYETTHRPHSKGKSSNGKVRRPPPKRHKPRVEQDSFGCGPQKDLSKVKRLCKMQRIELTMSQDARDRLRKLSWENRREDGTLEPEITTIRRFLVAKRLTQLKMIRRLEYGAPKSSMQAKLTQVELRLLDQVAREFEVSRGEVIEAGIWEFFPVNSEI